jgi:predicted GNAT family acetyltransferase
MEWKKENNNICLQDEGGKILAYVSFPEVGANTVEVAHTVVSPTLRGQGIAAELVQMAVDQIREQGGKVRATCSYASVWLEQHK